MNARADISPAASTPSPISATPAADKTEQPPTRGELYLLISRARLRYLDGEDFADALLDEAGANLY
jgi:hypothetical protein